MIGAEWLLNELDLTCADNVESMTRPEFTIAQKTLSEMCMNYPEGSHTRNALRTAIAWLNEKYIDILSRAVTGDA